MKIIREYILEKFEEESDPVHDMGIGLKPMWDNLKKGDVLQLIKRLQIEGAGNYVYPEGSLILISSVQNIDEEGDKKFLICTHYRNLKSLKNDKPAKWDRVDVTWRMSFDFFKEYFQFVNIKDLKESLNEKFSEEGSDPIHDMGIGTEELFKNLKAGDILRAKHKIVFFNGDKIWPKNSLIEIIRILPTSEKEKRFRYNFYRDKIDFKRGQPEIENHDWTITYPFFLSHFDIVNHKELNEKFSEEGSDPIRDMGIGAEYDILLEDNFKPFRDEYRRKYNPHYNDPQKDHVNPTGMKKEFMKFKEDIEPLILNKFVEGKMWQVNRGWVDKKIYVYSIKGLGSKTMFHPNKTGWSFFHVKAAYYSMITGGSEVGEFGLYLNKTYHVTLK